MGKQTITVPTRSGPKAIEVEVIGWLGVHPTVYGQKPGWTNWTLTALANGRALILTYYQKEARKWAKVVVERFPTLESALGRQGEVITLLAELATAEGYNLRTEEV